MQSFEMYTFFDMLKVIIMWPFERYIRRSFNIAIKFFVLFYQGVNWGEQLTI